MFFVNLIIHVLPSSIMYILAWKFNNKTLEENKLLLSLVQLCLVLHSYINM